MDVADYVEVNSQRDAAKNILRSRYEYMAFYAQGNNTPSSSVAAKAKIEEVKYCVSLEAMSMIRERLNTYNFALLQTAGRTAPRDLEDAFERGAAICGHQAAGFLDLVRSVGLTARSVQVYGIEPSGLPISHIACEVLLGDKYRLFDVTSAAVFVDAKNLEKSPTYHDLLSFEELIATAPGMFRCISNPLCGWKSQFPKNTEFHDLEYFASRKPSAVSWSVGMAGAIRPVHLEKQSYGLTITASGIPNFLGRADDHGVPLRHVRGMELIVEDPRAPAELQIELSALQKPTTTTAHLQLYDPVTNEVLDESVADVGNVALRIPPPRGGPPRKLRLSLVADDAEATCYAVWRQVELRYSSPEEPRTIVHAADETKPINVAKPRTVTASIPRRITALVRRR